MEKILISKFVNKNGLSYPTHSVHIFAENNSVGEHNKERITELNAINSINSINAIGKNPAESKISQSQIEAINVRKISDTGNLAFNLDIKNGTQVILTININLKDRLVNGLVVMVMGFKYIGNTVKVIYVKFNDKKAGKMAIQGDNLARQNCRVLIGKHYFL